MRRRPTLWGLVSGLFLSVVLLTASLPALYPMPTEAAVDPKASCFTLMDCDPKMNDYASQCNSPAGCCVGAKCFAPTDVCGNQGAVKMGGCFARGAENMTLQVNIGSYSTAVDMGEYISTVYKYAVGIGGVLAAVMMMIGGMMYLTAADSDRLSRGKQYIVDALTGMAVILGAYMILNTVNPALLSLNLPKIPLVKKQSYVGCSLTRLCASCGMNYNVTNKYVKDLAANIAGENGAKLSDPSKICLPEYVNTDGKDVATSCVGKGCHCLNQWCAENNNTCQKAEGNTKAKCGWDSSVTLANGGVPVGSGGGGASAGGSGAAAGGSGSAEGGAAAPPPPPVWGCFKCDGDGAPCSPNGANDKCCGGYCGNSICSTGMPGEACESSNKECAFGFCQTAWSNSCSAGTPGSSCDADDECQSSKCIGTGSGWLNLRGSAHINLCGTKNLYARCSGPDDCSTGGCAAEAQGFFSITTALTTGVCLGSSAFFPCTSNDWCNNQTGGKLKYCALVWKHVCTDGSVGSACTANDQCAEGHCITQGTGSHADVCGDGKPGSMCDDDADCGVGGAPGHCFEASGGNVCVTGSLGSRCKNAADCTSPFTCQTTGYADAGQMRCAMDAGQMGEYCLKPPAAQ